MIPAYRREGHELARACLEHVTAGLPLMAVQRIMVGVIAEFEKYLHRRKDPRHLERTSRFLSRAPAIPIGTWRLA